MIQRRQHANTSGPIARTLHSFVLGFLLGCVVCYITSVGRRWCVGIGCGLNSDESYMRLQASKLYHNVSVSAAQTRTVFTTAHSNSDTMCPKGPIRILVLILSDPFGDERRNAIRATWLKERGDSQYKVEAKFVIGTRNLTSETRKGLSIEQNLFHDLHLLPELQDAYTNLTTKMWMLLKWAHKNAKFDFLVKADDDSYVRLKKLATALRSLNCDDRLYWGYFMGSAIPILTGRWAETKWLQCSNYLPYAMGGGYVLAKKVVDIIARYADRLKFYSNEDVTLGSWLAPYKLVRKHDLRFDVESHTHGCSNSYIISHKQRVYTMREKYNSLIVNKTLCVLEKEIRPAYIYNWTTLPMDCCHRVKGLTVTDNPL